MTEKTIVATHLGGMHFDVRTGSGHDVTLDDGESDTGPRPTEMLLTSLTTCTAMDIASLLTKKRQVFTAYHVEARALQQEEYPQVFTWIEIVHVLEGTRLEDRAVRRSIELSATKYCPINAMLSSGPTEIHHRFRIIDTSPGESEVREGEVIVTGPFASFVPIPS